MHLSDMDIKEFQDMWFKRFNKNISKEEARDRAINLLELVEVVYQPLSEGDLLMVEESRKQIYGEQDQKLQEKEN